MKPCGTFIQALLPRVAKAIPGVGIETEKCGFKQKGEAFDHEWQNNDLANDGHEWREQHCKGYGNDDARYGTNNKQYGHGIGIILSQSDEALVFPQQANAFHDAQQQRDTHAKQGKGNVKSHSHPNKSPTEHNSIHGSSIN